MTEQRRAERARDEPDGVDARRLLQREQTSRSRQLRIGVSEP